MFYDVKKTMPPFTLVLCGVSYAGKTQIGFNTLLFTRSHVQYVHLKSGSALSSCLVTPKTPEEETLALQLFPLLPVFMLSG